MTEANPRYPALRREVLEALSDVARVARETGAATLAEKLERDRIPRLEAERFHLVVLGEFNHGKTSFVNALLEGEVLPTGVTPTTAVLHTLSFGERRAHVEHEDGRHVPLAWTHSPGSRWAAPRRSRACARSRWRCPRRCSPTAWCWWTRPA